MKNPWIGLSSYTEESLKEYQFNGRAKASAVLGAMIRNNLFITLYGRSGIGKTSLLQAGVFPLLRLQGYIPVYLRLAGVRDDDNKSAACILWEILCQTLKKDGIEYESWDKADKYEPDFNDLLVLRKLFAAGRFVKDGETIIPVIILDQFEEVLYNAPKAGDLLVRQLYALVNDKYNLTIPHPSWHTGNDFRIVVSIREDDLFLLEDIIDKRNCSGFKSNRYRLLPLSDEEAREVILNPLKEENVIPPEQEDEIVEKIISLSKGDGESINTLMLSLICHVLFENSIAKKKPILEELSKFDDNVDTYYKMVTKELPERQRYYLEDHLVDDQGRRTSIYLSDLRRNAPQAEELSKNTNKRILNVNQDRVELIHDQLAATVAKSRANRKSKKARYWGISLLIILLLGIFLFSFTYTPNQTKTISSAAQIANNVHVEHFIIDSLGPYPPYNHYFIYDCPNLKSIKVEKDSAIVCVYRCHNLVDVEIKNPLSFKGKIKLHDCPNVKKDAILDKDAIFEDSPNWGNSVSEVNVYDFTDGKEIGLYRASSPTRVIKEEGENIFFPFHPFESTFTATLHTTLKIGNKHIGNKEVKSSEDCLLKQGVVFTNIDDSIKRQKVCYVPYGYKDDFIQLSQFKPFKEIKEKSILWYIGEVMSYSISYLKSYTGWFGIKWIDITIGIIGVVFVLIVYLLAFFANKKLRKVTFKTKKEAITAKLKVILLSFIKAIGICVIGVLGCFAIYWLIYNVISPGNQSAGAIFGLISGILCVMIVFFPRSFYRIWQFLKSLRKSHPILAVKNWLKKNK